MTGQKNNVRLPRDEPFSFTLATASGGSIKAMVSLGSHLEIYTPTETFKTQTPESIDPDRTNPNAMFVNVKIADVGCSNPIVARTLITAHNVLQSGLILSGPKREEALKLVSRIKNTLLQCEAAAAEFHRHAQEQQTRFEKTVQRPESRTLENFPVIPDIDALVTAFLIPARRVITDVCQIPNLFWPFPRQHSNLDHLLEKELIPLLGTDHRIVEWFRGYQPLISLIIDLRNGQEHTSTTKAAALVVKNFEQLPSNEVHVPLWHLEGQAPAPIDIEMAAIVDHLTTFAEVMFVACAEAALPEFPPMFLSGIETVDPECPVQYEFLIDASRFDFSGAEATKRED